jgi:hypothetical protein
MDKEKWLKFFHERTGIDRELLEKAFKDEIDGKFGINDPLEVPDRMDVTYKYSYGGHSRFFREIKDNKRIMGAKCSKCGFVYCPPRIGCSKCYAPTEWVPLSGKGRIEACTVVHYGTSSFIGKFPYLCGYIKLDGADTFILQFIESQDISEVKPGMRVEACFREERYGMMTDFYFKPVE